MPRHRYSSNYRRSQVVLLPFFSAVQKFLQPPVHILVGFLTRPVRAHESCYDAGHGDKQYDFNSSFHMIKVPCIRPCMSEIAIADANMPKMIQNRSMLVPSQGPEVITHLNQAQECQCDQYGQQCVHDPVNHVSLHSRHTCSTHTSTYDTCTYTTCTVSSQTPYCDRYCYEVICYDQDLHYHT